MDEETSSTTTNPQMDQLNDYKVPRINSLAPSTSQVYQATPITFCDDIDTSIDIKPEPISDEVHENEAKYYQYTNSIKQEPTDTTSSVIAPVSTVAKSEPTSSTTPKTSSDPDKYKSLRVKTMTVKFNGELIKLLFCSYCNKHTNNRATMLEHYRLHVQVGDHKQVVCNRCSKRFVDSVILSEHYKTDHKIHSVYIENPNFITCKICNLYFNNGNELYDHYVEHSRTASNMCHFCFYSACSVPKLQRHINAVHLQKNIVCTKCPTAFSHQETYDEHITRNHYKFTSSCIYCQLPLTGRNLREYHMYYLHSCAFCDFVCKEFSLLKQHCLADHNIKLILRVDTQTNDEMRNINVEDSAPYLYQCQNCQLLTNCFVDIAIHSCNTHYQTFKALSVPKLLRMDELWQSQRDSFIHRFFGVLVCKLCHFETSSEQIMISHINQHKPIYECKLCLQYFPSRPSAVLHNSKSHNYAGVDNYKSIKPIIDIYSNLMKNNSNDLPMLGLNFAPVDMNSVSFMNEDNATNEILNTPQLQSQEEENEDDEFDELFETLIPVPGNSSLIYCKVCCKKLSIRNPSVDVVSQHLRTKEHVNKHQKLKTNITVASKPESSKTDPSKKSIDNSKNSEDVDDPAPVTDMEETSCDVDYSADLSPLGSDDSQSSHTSSVGSSSHKSKNNKGKSMSYSQLHHQRSKKREFPVWFGQKTKRRRNNYVINSDSCDSTDDFIQDPIPNSSHDVSGDNRQGNDSALNILDAEKQKAIRSCKQKKVRVILNKLPDSFLPSQNTTVHVLNKNKNDEVGKILKAHKKTSILGNSLTTNGHTHINKNTIPVKNVSTSANHVNASKIANSGLGGQQQSNLIKVPFIASNNINNMKKVQSNIQNQPETGANTPVSSIGTKNNPKNDSINYSSREIKSSYQKKSLTGMSASVQSINSQNHPLLPKPKPKSPSNVSNTSSQNSSKEANNRQEKIDQMKSSRKSKKKESNSKKSPCSKNSNSVVEKSTCKNTANQSPKSLFKCDTCSFVSILIQGIFSHFEKKHPEKKIIIPIEEEKVIPNVIHHSGYRCIKCKLIGSKSYMLKHLATHAQYTCVICLYYTNKYETMVQHKLKCFGFYCNICNFSSSSANQINVHYVNVHKAKVDETEKRIYSTRYNIVTNKPVSPEEFTLD